MSPVGGVGFKAHGWPPPTVLLAPENTKFQDSARTTAALANNDPVGSWTDKGSAATNCNQATAANRPLLKTAVVNGLDALEFDGTNDSLSAAMAALANQTWFIVARLMAAPAGVVEKPLLGVRLNSTNRLRPWVVNHSASDNYRFFADQATQYQALGTDVVTDWHVLVQTWTAAQAKAWCDGGAADATFDPNDIVTTAVTYQLCGDNTASFGNYQVAEARRYSKVLSLDDINLVGGHLANKFALTWTAAT